MRDSKYILDLVRLFISKKYIYSCEFGKYFIKTESNYKHHISVFFKCFNSCFDTKFAPKNF